jgi:predicted TIM-barrel fold metal-dependent hydrolase
MGRFDQLLRQMDGCGVEKAIILPYVSERTPDNNERCARHAREFPDRLATLTDVQLHEPTATAQVARAREKYGAVGISYYPARPGLSWMTGPACDPLWEAFDASDLVCNLQITPTDYPVLLQLCTSHPQVRFVINHLGLPGGLADDDTSYGGLLDGVALPNLYVKASAFYASAGEPWDLRDRRALRYFSRLLQGLGAHRILWGSDWPPAGWHLTYRQTLEILRHAATDLDAEGRDQVLGGNAARVYRV